MRELEIRYGSARFALYRGNGCRPCFETPKEAVFSRVPPISDKNWGWHMWDEDRLTMRSLSSLTGFNGAGSEFKKVLQECEDGQSTYLDYWVSGIHCDNIQRKYSKLML